MPWLWLIVASVGCGSVEPHDLSELPAQEPTYEQGCEMGWVAVSLAIGLLLDGPAEYCIPGTEVEWRDGKVVRFDHQGSRCDLSDQDWNTVHDKILGAPISSPDRTCSFPFDR